MKWSVLLLLVLISSCASFSDYPVSSERGLHNNPAIQDQHARFR